MNAGTNESAKEAARRFAAPMLAKGYQPEALHEYNAADGSVLFYRIRAKHPETGDKWIRPMKLNGQGYELGEPKFLDGKPLYGLPRITSNLEAVVWIVEGEQKADELNKRGLVATTSGGSTSAKAADWKPLRGRTVRTWPDNDDPGKAYANEVARILHGLGCAVSCLDVSALGLPDKGDAVDWIQARPGATGSDIEALPIRRVQPEETHTLAADPGGASLVLLAGESIKPEPVRWLWDGWLAQGKLHILAGAPGTGKTTIALALAATVTLGGRWPDGSRAAAGSVLIASFEDDPKDTLAPRLLAMGADMTRIKFLSAVREGDELRSLNAGDHAPLLAEAIARHDVRLVIVDPVISALGSFDSHRNAETRAALQPFADVAADTGVALLGIAHFSKGTAGREPLERVSGSLAFGALARVVLGAAKIKSEDNSERRVLLRLKSNLGPDTGGFEYTLEQNTLQSHPGVSASRVSWGNAIEGSARELLAEAETADDGEGGALAEASAWLRSLLTDAQDHSLDKRTIIDLGRGSGFAERTLHRARESLGIEPRVSGFGRDKRSIWALPNGVLNPAILAIHAESCQTKELGTTGTIEKMPDLVEGEL